jgi:hypothetical protein
MAAAAAYAIIIIKTSWPKKIGIVFTNHGAMRHHYHHHRDDEDDDDGEKRRRKTACSLSISFSFCAKTEQGILLLLLLFCHHNNNKCWTERVRRRYLDSRLCRAVPCRARLIGLFVWEIHPSVPMAAAAATTTITFWRVNLFPKPKMKWPLLVCGRHKTLRRRARVGTTTRTKWRLDVPLKQNLKSIDVRFFQLRTNSALRSTRFRCQ